MLKTKKEIIDEVIFEMVGFRLIIEQEGFGIYSNLEVRDIIKDIERKVKQINY